MSNAFTRFVLSTVVPTSLAVESRIRIVGFFLHLLQKNVEEIFRRFLRRFSTLEVCPQNLVLFDRPAHEYMTDANTLRTLQRLFSQSKALYKSSVTNFSPYSILLTQKFQHSHTFLYPVHSGKGNLSRVTSFCSNSTRVL